MLHNVTEKVRECIDSITSNVDSITDGEDFREILGFDTMDWISSLDEVELIMGIEDEFDLNQTLADDSLIEYKTIDSLSKFIERGIESGLLK